MPKGFTDFAFLAFIITMLVTVGGKNGQKLAYYFLLLILLSMVVINKDKVNTVLSNINV